VYPGDDPIGGIEKRDLAFAAPPQPDADAARLVALSGRKVEQRHRVRAPPRRRTTVVLRFSSRLLGDRNDGNARSGLAEPNDVTRLEQAFAGQSPAVHVGAIQTGEVYQEPPRHAVSDLRMHAGHHAGTLP